MTDLTTSPYFQTTENNGIDVGNSTFFAAYDATVAAAEGKSVWITETGWPVGERHLVLIEA